MLLQSDTTCRPHDTTSSCGSETRDSLASLPRYPMPLSPQLFSKRLPSTGLKHAPFDAHGVVPPFFTLSAWSWSLVPTHWVMAVDSDSDSSRDD